MVFRFVNQAWTELCTPAGRGISVIKTLSGINVPVWIFLKDTINCLLYDPKATSNEYGVIVFAHLIYFIIQYAMFPLLMLLSRIIVKLYVQIFGQPTPGGWTLGDWSDSVLGIIYGFFVTKIWRIAKGYGSCMRRENCSSDSWFIYPMTWATMFCQDWRLCASYIYQSNNAIVALAVGIVNYTIWSLWDHPDVAVDLPQLRRPEPDGNPPLPVPAQPNPAPADPAPEGGPRPRQGLVITAEIRRTIEEETDRRIDNIRQQVRPRLCNRCVGRWNAAFNDVLPQEGDNQRSRSRSRPRVQTPPPERRSARIRGRNQRR